MVMGHLQSSGLKFLRVWGFNDVNSDPGSSKVWFQKLENGQQTINTGFNGLQRLDYVVKSAEAHGIKLIIPFVNYWNDYGGMNTYVNSHGGNLTEWYTNTAAQSAFQNYIKVVVGRYIGSPAIFAWELANEPRCRGCSTDVIYNWAKTTSEFIKTLEPNRMVCIGDEGMGLTTGSDGSYPYTFYEENDWEKTLTIPTIDFGTFHLERTRFMGLFMGHYSRNSLQGRWETMPLRRVRFGYPPNEAPWQTTAIGSVAADSFWQWGDTLSSGNSPNDKYAIYYGSSDYTTLVTNHVAAINGAA
ncbi:uncharacterized protein TRUGW13939_00852 [Talaromyces rugulosus]|uniref:mannan endo-1,4-beta-mannosidase n=1 Tax=Talaromyces rugulosus TaxID=121627 RepID=A0A7H8QJD9_TALRU|nr:uncharacterized protein TRUGW13939_00852 [Talaromyces rugulosus]QKX53772.1 hypothetical protein TRUGW13939_00852 [Talaromyces rugulosus]